jgi:hypothetical protein
LEEKSKISHFKKTKKYAGFRLKKSLVFAILSGKVRIFRREQREMLYSNSRKTTITNFSAKINYTGVKRIRRRKNECF